MELLPGCSYLRLTLDKIIKPFDCGDNDLNDFLKNDSCNYLKDLLAVTYLIENATETVAFFSILNDKIMQEDCTDKSKWNKFRKIFRNSKRFKSYPAVKIARLGVTNSFKSQKIGTILLDYLKILFLTNNRTGCRFITVDAYKESLMFYEKNGFKYMTETDAASDTRLMYFDLYKIPISFS